MFQSSCVIETRLSDVYVMTVANKRKTFKKVRPTIPNKIFRTKWNKRRKEK